MIVIKWIDLHMDNDVVIDLHLIATVTTPWFDMACRGDYQF